MKTMIEHALEIAKDVFDEAPACISWCMHVKENLMHSVGNVGSCERQVLECSGNTAVERCIRVKITISFRSFRLSLHRYSELG